MICVASLLSFSYMLKCSTSYLSINLVIFTLQSVLHRCACIAIISVNKENRKRETMVRGSMDPNFSRAREREKEDSIQISNQSVSVDCRELLTRRWSCIILESDRNLFQTKYSAEYLTEYSAETE